PCQVPRTRRRRRAAAAADEGGAADAGSPRRARAPDAQRRRRVAIRADRRVSDGPASRSQPAEGRERPAEPQLHAGVARGLPRPQGNGGLGGGEGWRVRRRDAYLSFESIWLSRRSAAL